MNKHHKSDWIKVGHLNDIPVAGARVVHTTIDGMDDIAIFRTADDQIFALNDKCPHRGGPLSRGMVYGHRVSCPMHGMQIDLKTGNAVKPDTGCASRYQVKLEGDEIFLSLTEQKECLNVA